ncbi:U32 family peptidase [Kordiimonas lipolytica]|uniref:U32 family peptidase n=1 Tax=Kordiimonas lipolytica TaxID=1662421 RepID=A0ABV8U5T1_9PROT|nr:U32 family peptidase [Kordiimonas lipolytica]
MTQNAPTLSLGPLLFNWPAENMRDFYFRIADEADLDIVYFGEVVCAKRRPFQLPFYEAILERLARGGKQVILSTLQLVMDTKDQQAVADMVAFTGDYLVEANDLSSCAALAGKPHALGPSVNIYNEDTLRYFEGEGATRISLNAELPVDSLQALADVATVDLEVQAFGRAPLAISARCFHARTHGLAKNGCQYVCEKDLDGLAVDTLDDQPFLAVNGLQTLSQAYLCLLEEIPALQDMGIIGLRLSPHSCDMVKVSEIYRARAARRSSATETLEALKAVLNGQPLANGFFHGEEGLKYVASHI